MNALASEALVCGCAVKEVEGARLGPHGIPTVGWHARRARRTAAIDLVRAERHQRATSLVPVPIANAGILPVRASLLHGARAIELRRKVVQAVIACVADPVSEGTHDGQRKHHA